MPSSFLKGVLSDMARTVNSAVGDQTTYTTVNGESISTPVVFDMNNKVTNDFGVLQGYNVVASVLKADVPRYRPGDTITDSDGRKWRVDALTKETTAKWYFEVAGV